jgi:mRNA interferase MazF
MGLLSDSMIMTDNLATILDSEFERVIGRCDDMQPINVALRSTLGLEL